jgi:tripartite-type tricarboxylate transporter receptor subunit TctC
LLVALLVVLVASMSLGSVFAASGDYPTKPIQVVVGWGAGGITDRSARGVAPVAEKFLGQPWVVTNMPGAAGAIGAAHVLRQNPDGYTLLFGSETMSIWQLMGLSEYSYKDFEPIMLCTQGVPAIAVNASRPWRTVQEFVEYAKANPRKIKLGIAGPATTGAVAAAILHKCLGTELSNIAFEGGGPAVTAALGGHVDVVMENLPDVVEHHKAGKLRILAIFDNERMETLPDVPALGEIYAGTRNYLPYGPYFGLFAPKGVPAAVVSTLTDAMKKTVADPRWQQYVRDGYFRSLALSGEEARKYLDEWTAQTAWLIYDLGVAKKSPEELGIPKP